MGLMASVDRDLPIVTDAVDPKAAVSATTEPVLGADAVDDRAVNPRARERGERHAPFLDRVAASTRPTVPYPTRSSRSMPLPSGRPPMSRAIDLTRSR